MPPDGDSRISKSLLKPIVSKIVDNLIGRRIKAVINSPKRFVLGIVVSAIVGWVLQILLLGLNLGQWLAGLRVPGTIRVDGDPVDVPWCGSEFCNATSLVDIPGILLGGLEHAFGIAGVEFLGVFGTIWRALPTGGLLGPVVLFVVMLALVVGLYWLVRVAIAVSPISLP